MTDRLEELKTSTEGMNHEELMKLARKIRRERVLKRINTKPKVKKRERIGKMMMDLSPEELKNIKEKLEGMED